MIKWQHWETEQAENTEIFSLFSDLSNLSVSVLQKIHPFGYHTNMAEYPQTTHPHSQITKQIIGIAIKIHKHLGPEFREKYYQRAMYLELQRTNLKFERGKKIRISYGKVTLGYHVVDFIVKDKVIVELKSMKELTDVEVGQLTTYLKLIHCQIGLLLNFGQPTLEIKRVKI